MLEYYASGTEARRLQQSIGRVEFLRTQEILARHLPESPAEVYDVGGGPGAYAFWLAVEGPSWIIPDIDQLWLQEDRQARLLEIARALEDESSLMGMSPHLLRRAWKPD